MKLFRAIPTFLLLVFFPLSSFAWNALGHMLVAKIAYQELTPQVRDKVDDIVSYLHQEYPEMATFVNIAYWPDAIRGQKIETYTHWHYIDNAFTLDGTPLKNLVDTDNAVWAFTNIENVVQNNRANPHERARFLSFLVHITADLHQPLHTVSLISALHPDGDKGGNAYRVRVGKNDVDAINLHKLWDEGLGEFSGSQNIADAATIAASITARYPKNSFDATQLNDLKPEDWAKEGMQNAKQYVYTTPENQVVSNEYIDAGKHISEQEIALAGYRLAALLNTLLA